MVTIIRRSRPAPALDPALPPLHTIHLRYDRKWSVVGPDGRRDPAIMCARESEAAAAGEAKYHRKVLMSSDPAWRFK